MLRRPPPWSWARENLADKSPHAESMQDAALCQEDPIELQLQRLRVGGVTQGLGFSDLFGLD